MPENSHASESQHWYDRDGNPVYEVMRADNSGMRSATLADARKMNLVPGFTSIKDCAARPQLESWKQKKAILSALTATRRNSETDEELIKRVLYESQEQSRKAAEKGIILHSVIGDIVSNARVVSASDEQFALEIAASLENVEFTCGKISWQAERSFAHPIGFGGKIDLIGIGWLIDIKTKEFDNSTKRLAWDEHCMQLAAYRHGINVPLLRCANLFISTSIPGLVRMHVWEETELSRGWQMFSALLSYWKAKTGYDTSFTDPGDSLAPGVA